MIKKWIWKKIFNIIFFFKSDCSKNTNLPPDGVRFHLLDKGKHITNIIGYDKEVKFFKRSTVCIQENESIYKILSVTASKKDGSLNIFFPYFKDENAFVFQYYHKYKAGQQTIKPKKIFRKFVLGRTAKLSIHRSGFVQLSGSGISSGIDPKTGMAKGVGLFSSPLDFPVFSGPTFSYQCFGLEDGFDKLEKKGNRNQYIILNKKEDDFTERRFNDDNDKEFDSYLLEFFIFPKEARRYVYSYKGKPYINHIISNYLHQPNFYVAHPVLDIEYFNGVICVFPVSLYTEFPDEIKTGYSLNSPGGSRRESDIRKTGTNFHLFCPCNMIKEGEGVNGLEYNNK
jgi:hypothetical protein